MEQSHHETHGQGETTRPAETDALFGVLANANRRSVLEHLAEREHDPSLDQLAAALAAWNETLSREDARIALHHVHLPKLAEVGIVTYDETISLTDDAARSLNLIDEA